MKYITHFLNPLWILLALICLPTSWAKNSTHYLSLDESLKLTLENSPQVKMAQNNFKGAQLTKKNAFFSFFPMLDLTSTHGLQNATPGKKQNDWTSAATLELSATLYDNGQNYTRYQVSSLQEKMAQLTWERERDQALLATTLAYYNYLRHQGQWAVKKELYQSLYTQFISMEKQFQVGQKMRRDYLRFKTELKRSQISLAQQEAQVKASLYEINRLMGVDQTDKRWVPDEISLQQALPEKKQMQTYFAPPSLDQFYDTKIYQLTLQTNQLNLRQKRRRLWPEVGFKTSVGHSRFDYLGPDEPGTSAQKEYKTSWQALITLNFNLFDWGTRRRDVEILDLQNNREAWGLQQGLLELQKTVQELSAQVQANWESYRLSQELLKLESETYQYLQQDYRQGQVSYLDLITAQQNLLNARTRFLEDVTELLSLVAKHHYYQGNLYDYLF